jgi:hypothetical protein
LIRDLKPEQSRIMNQELLRLLMVRMLPTEPAVLAELQPVGRLLLVLRRAVIASFADAARQMNDVSHGDLSGFRLGAAGFGRLQPEAA